MKILPLSLIVAILFISPAFSQKKVVIMGSSTAIGFGASAYSLSWAGRLTAYYNQNTTDGKDTVFTNIAVSGYNTYQEMPAGFTPPAGRPVTDPAANVTKALSYNPDIVIINLPSNDVGDGFSMAETMNNFRLMYSSITASGAKCFITTTQPRNDYTIAQRQMLLSMKDSINAQFGVFAVNFWDDLVTSDGLNNLRDDRRDPLSQVHPNDSGHYYLFQRMVAKNIFGIIILPVTITNFTAQINNNAAVIKWHIEQQQPTTVFKVERSANGIDYETILSVNAAETKLSADYTVMDKNPLAPTSFYRIKVSTPSQQFYSNTVSVINKNNTFGITKLYKDMGAENLIADISVQKNEIIYTAVINASGAVLQQKKQSVNTPSAKIILPIFNLPAGQYFIKISTADNKNAIKSFIK